MDEETVTFYRCKYCNLYSKSPGDSHSCCTRSGSADTEWSGTEYYLASDYQELSDEHEKELKLKKTEAFEIFPEAAKSSTISVILAAKEPSDEAVSYTLHTKQLASVSEYFKKLLQSPGKEKTDGVVTLSASSAHPVAFGYFVQFMYNKNYLLDTQHTAIAPVMHAMIYILADHLSAATLKTCSISKLKDALNDALNRPSDLTILGLVDVVYRRTGRKKEDSEPVLSKKRKLASVKSEVQEVGRDEKPSSMLFGLGKDKKDSELLYGLGIGFDADTAKPSPSTTDPLRSLVAQYTKGRWESLKNYAKCRSLLVEFPEFYADVI
ncbi:hypothetical protein BJ508DRAFT_327466 [Ascobolus immersus RN42]|uniref:BTB domain-containing protein n=1 Tax=Ascobolus immersus RN42 TaxID=1160509 RepID=A0A3N4I6P3_ASCIM|nr:hypothetical protein BJ508DRAFT_327466 [Ascobolus immersus RN42]